MTAFISHTTIDCANAYELSEWWKPAAQSIDAHTCDPGIGSDPDLPSFVRLATNDE